MPDSEVTQQLPRMSAADRSRLFRTTALELRAMAAQQHAAADRLEDTARSMRSTANVQNDTSIDLDAVAANLDRLIADGVEG